MSDEGKLRRQHDRGERAKQLMQNELLTEAFDEIEKAIMERFKESRADEKELREDAHRSIRLLSHIKGHLKHVMVTGEAARKELLNIKDPSKIKRMFGT